MSPAATRPRVQVIIGSTRPGRTGLAVGRWIADYTRNHGGFTVEIVDLAEVALPLTRGRGPMAGRTFRESGFAADAPVGAASLLYSIGDSSIGSAWVIVARDAPPACRNLD